MRSRKTQGDTRPFHARRRIPATTLAHLVGLSLCVESLRHGSRGSSGSTFLSQETQVSWGSLQPNMFTRKLTSGNSDGWWAEGVGLQGRQGQRVGASKQESTGGSHLSWVDWRFKGFVVPEL